MGDEFGQTSEWDFTKSLDWDLLQYPVHKGLQTLVKDLNSIYKDCPAFYENQFQKDGFEWIEADDLENSVYIYLRKGKKRDDVFMIVLNLLPKVIDYKIGVKAGTHWEVIFNSDDERYSGSGVEPEVFGEQYEEYMRHPKSIALKLPPLAGVILKQTKDKKYKNHRSKFRK